MPSDDVLSGYGPDKYPGRLCCGMLEHFVANGYKYPFERPIRVSFVGDMQGLSVLGWAVNFFKSKPNGKIDQTKNGKVTVFISFCPFCGHRLHNLAIEDPGNKEDNGGSIE